ncbi:hypothetical protein GCM10008955_30000 [Deinococcus malanensis]|uniref:Uncharacterized protein n=1 Tax=Deinococcus malanensis TaxID=1706855 RepID=A0ABQ2EZ60_9DEIO|nr:hypothetical protein GCM10008955_30000 [Deinococcus malanensis]
MGAGAGTREGVPAKSWEEPLPKGSNLIDVHMSNIRARLRDLEAFGLLRSVRDSGMHCGTLSKSSRTAHSWSVKSEAYPVPGMPHSKMKNASGRA